MSKVFRYLALMAVTLMFGCYSPAVAGIIAECSSERATSSPAFEGHDVPSWNAFKGGFQWAEWEDAHRIRFMAQRASERAERDAYRGGPDGPRRGPGVPWDETDPRGGH